MKLKFISNISMSSSEGYQISLKNLERSSKCKISMLSNLLKFMQISFGVAMPSSLKAVFRSKFSSSALKPSSLLNLSILKNSSTSFKLNL